MTLRDMKPGAYDHVAAVARETVHAEAVALLVVHGTRGSGFSYLTSRDPATLRAMAHVLRTAADDLDRDAEAIALGARRGN